MTVHEGAPEIVIPSVEIRDASGDYNPEFLEQHGIDSDMADTVVTRNGVSATLAEVLADPDCPIGENLRLDVKEQDEIDPSQREKVALEYIHSAAKLIRAKPLAAKAMERIVAVDEKKN